MSHQLNGPTLLAWMALGFEPDPTDQIQSRRVWENALNDPGIQVNAQFHGETLFMRVLTQTGPKGKGPAKHVLGLMETQFTADPLEDMTLALLKRGADPWARTMEPNDQPPWRALEIAMKQGALATVQAILAHPNCPSLDSLLTVTYEAGLIIPDKPLCENLYRWPGVAQAFVLAGLDPNWQDRSETPFFFHAQDVDVVKWLAKKGAELSRLNAQGIGLLTHIENVVDMGTEQRTRWVLLQGHHAVSDDHIVRMGLSNAQGKVDVLFDPLEAKFQWRHQPEGMDREISMLDLAVMATINQSKATIDAPGAAHAKLLLHNSDAHWSQETLDLVSVLYLMTENSQQCQRMLRGIGDFVKLGSVFAGMITKDNERFGDWLAATREKSEQYALADHWVTWLQSQPGRWSLPLKTGLTEPAIHWLRSRKDMPARIEVAACGASLMLKAPGEADTERLIGRLLDALDRLDTTLEAPEWQGLRDSVDGSPHGPVFVAMVRERRAKISDGMASSSAARTRHRP